MKKVLILCLSLASVVIVVYACGKGSGGSYSSTPALAPTPGAGNTVTISNYAFQAASLTVKIGTTVTWTNADDITHTVTADDNSFSGGDLVKGSTFSHAFSAAWTVNYHCKYHPMMVANVKVN